MTKPTTRRIEVGALTRVEGEGALQVEVVGDRVDRVNLAIYEPPRFFEALLVGRPLEDVPDVTARICGICPIAYQNTSVFALEQALGIEVTPEIQQLRRLLYCAEWIESHGLHMHLLNIPDFFDCSSGIDLAKQYPEEVNRGLRLKKHGNELLEVLGGRAVHPINITVGGFYRAPSRQQLLALVEDLKWGLDASIDVARWVADFEFPDFTQPYEMVALRHPTEYPMNHGRIVSTAGLDIEVQQYENHFEERQVEHSTALHAVRAPEGQPYFVGPLARINQNLDRLSPIARQLADDVEITWPCFNPYQSIVARAIEMVQAYDESIQIINEYQPPGVARIEYEPREGEGMAATEAPRGLIFHRYKTDRHGRITAAKIVPPTSQNQGQIEQDLRELLPGLLQHEDRDIAIRCEKLIRTYDPCISCSTHFLKLDLKRR